MSKDYVEVYRFTPENRYYSNPEIVATFTPHKKSAIHSFAITENYAVFFFPPMTYQTKVAFIRISKFINMKGTWRGQESICWPVSRANSYGGTAVSEFYRVKKC